MAVPRLPSQSYSVVGSLGKTPYSRFCGPPRGVDLTANIGLHDLEDVVEVMPPNILATKNRQGVADILLA